MQAEREVDRWNWLVRAVLAGFSATVTMMAACLFGYLLAAPLSQMRMAEVKGPFGSTEVLRSWLVALVDNPLVDLGRAPFYGAFALHASVGVFLAIVYAELVEPRLRGRGWMRGALFSLVPCLLSLVVFMPLLGMGVFGWKMGAGPFAALANLLLHLVYGATLGALYAPASERLVERTASAQADQAEQRALQGAERGGLIGMLVGFLLGLLIGYVTFHMFGGVGAGASIGLFDMWVLVAGPIVGASLGTLVGTLAALPTAVPTRHPS